jgi:hypothetical protein
MHVPTGWPGCRMLFVASCSRLSRCLHATLCPFCACQRNRSALNHVPMRTKATRHGALFLATRGIAFVRLPGARKRAKQNAQRRPPRRAKRGAGGAAGPGRRAHERAGGRGAKKRPGGAHKGGQQLGQVRAPTSHEASVLLTHIC